MKSPRAAWPAVALACTLAFDAHASCGAAFCMTNTDWYSQGVWTEPGTRFELRYETIDLDQPMNGRDKVAVGQIPRHHDEVETKNRNWIASIDHNFGNNWGVSLYLPWVDRDHLHIHNHHGEQIPEQWDFRELADVRVVGRYQFLPAKDDADQARAAGVLFGVKLPTGKYDVVNGEGEAAERTLQPGTGTTDLILGAYWHAQAPIDDSSWFAQIVGSAPLNSKDGFKPGNKLAIDLGYRYEATRDIGLTLQLNYLAKGRDSGVNAEPDDSGQRIVTLSPGINWAVTRDVQLYAFVQVPVYQAVNGVQLTADYAIAAGVGWRF
jgi:hypothetical protein